MLECVTRKATTKRGSINDDADQEPSDKKHKKTIRERRSNHKTKLPKNVGRVQKKSIKSKPEPITVALKAVPEPKVKKHIELDKQRFNIRTIIQCSNATPIRTHYVGIGYACCFCKRFFPKAADLKMHTIKDHNLVQKSKFMSNVFISAFLVKLDVTDLQCNICNAELNALEDLTVHLNAKHDMNLNTDIKNLTICFKLHNEELKCMFCQIECSSFKVLREHMNQHYNNFICDLCGAGFVTQEKLWVHADVHRKGEFRCEICDKVFDKSRSLKHHTRMTHKVTHRYKCFQCGGKFASNKSKKEHMTAVHGAQFSKIPCLACDRTFNEKAALRIHTQRDHLMERRFKCPDCERSFYTNAFLRNHSLVHSGVRAFKCDLCGRDFARKKTLLTHMRTHKDALKKGEDVETVAGPLNLDDTDNFI